MAVRIRDAAFAGITMMRLTAVAVSITLALFQLAYVSNLHVHVLPDGRVVVHSHPVERDSNSGSGHKHSQNEHAFLNALGKLLQADISDHSPAPVCLVSIQLRTDSSDQCIILPIHANSVCRRGPPESAGI